PHFTLVAELDGVIVGFIYVVLDNDPRWGAVVQNLHVATEKKRQGVGSRLLTDAARAVLGSRPTSGMYVFVREDNAPARSFYAARAGAAVESTLGGPFPDGRRASVVRYAWLDLSLLTESTA